MIWFRVIQWGWVVIFAAGVIWIARRESKREEREVDQVVREIRKPK